jgi:hypothetical protein
MIQLLFFDLCMCGKIVPAYKSIIVIDLLLRIKQMAAEEGWVYVLLVGSTILIGTMKNSRCFTFASLLIDVNTSTRRTFVDLMSQLSSANTSVHFNSNIYY